VPKIVYLHGLASVGAGPKTDALIAAFGAENVTAPDLPLDPIELEDIVDTIVRGNASYPLIFVGTSLGGFWANYFAQKYNANCVLINPATVPSQTLGDKVGTDVRNYKTDELITVLPEYISEFKVRERYLANETNGTLINLFVAKNDEVLAVSEMLDNIPFYASRTVKEDGGHRFEKHWNEVVAKVAELVNA
jgi:predicted esterase YcpF (UPF0227 family)